jgi:hypothetical protein
MADPPSDAGAVKAIVADASPPVTEDSVGASEAGAHVEVITRLLVVPPVYATTTNLLLPKIIAHQKLEVDSELRVVQLIPSGLVITLSVPELATATNNPLPYATEYQLAFAAEFRIVQLIPSVLLITRLPVPVLATATKRPLP